MNNHCTRKNWILPVIFTVVLLCGARIADVLVPDATAQSTAMQQAEHLPPSAEHLAGALLCDFSTKFSTITRRRGRELKTYLASLTIPRLAQFAMAYRVCFDRLLVRVDATPRTTVPTEA